MTRHARDPAGRREDVSTLSTCCSVWYVSVATMGDLRQKKKNGCGRASPPERKTRSVGRCVPGSLQGTYRGLPVPSGSLQLPSAIPVFSNSYPV